MGGQCPGAPELKGGPDRERERKGEKEDKEKRGMGGPESPLSMGPEYPRYATVLI